MRSLAWVPFAAAIFVAALARAEDAGVCGPFAPYERGSPEAEACSEAGIQPSAALQTMAFDEIERLGASTTERQSSRIPGEALLALPKGADGKIPLDFELAPGVKIAESYFSPVLCSTVARITGPPGVEPTSFVAKLPDGATVVPHHRFVAAATEVRSFEPSNDQYREYQYALTQLGAERAWSVSRGEGVKLALLDSAPAASHPDLAGLRFLDESGEETSEAPPPATHGTLMAGVLAAASGNSIGIAGLAPAVTLLAVPVCSPSPDGGPDLCALYDVLRGIDQAWKAEASIFNLSLVGPSNPLFERSVARLERLGRVVVAAAGNEGAGTPRYPAAYPSVIGVGAVDRDGERYARTNSGFAVELFAPGVGILSTRPPNGFAFGDGTSLAAAHVSGALAVLVGAGIDPIEARHRLVETGASVDDEVAGRTGRLSSLCNALAAAGHPCPD